VARLLVHFRDKMRITSVLFRDPLSLRGTLSFREHNGRCFVGCCCSPCWSPLSLSVPFSSAVGNLDTGRYVCIPGYARVRTRLRAAISAARTSLDKLFRTNAAKSCERRSTSRVSLDKCLQYRATVLPEDRGDPRTKERWKIAESSLVIIIARGTTGRIAAIL